MRNVYGTQLEFIGTHCCFTDLRKGCTERIGTHTGTMSFYVFAEGLHGTHPERMRHLCASYQRNS